MKYNKILYIKKTKRNNEILIYETIKIKVKLKILYENKKNLN